MAWIVVAVGAAVFGFTFTLIADVSLSYLMDCYQEVSVYAMFCTPGRIANISLGRG